jgi:hypothetical protein
MTCRFCHPWGKEKDDLTDQQACKFYTLCEAPFCPLETACFKGIWYPGEEICRSRIYGNLSWIQVQRKLIKANVEGCFTMEMLNRDCILKTGIRGLDPDKEEKPQLQEWMKKHPRKRELSDEEKIERRKKAEGMKFWRSGKQGSDPVSKIR